MKLATSLAEDTEILSGTGKLRMVASGGLAGAGVHLACGVEAESRVTKADLSGFTRKKKRLLSSFSFWPAQSRIAKRQRKMTKYQVHFETASSVGYVRRGIRTIVARNEAEAIIKCKSVVANSFGHWVNRLANEVA